MMGLIVGKVEQHAERTLKRRGHKPTRERLRLAVTAARIAYDRGAREAELREAIDAALPAGKTPLDPARRFLDWSPLPDQVYYVPTGTECVRLQWPVGGLCANLNDPARRFIEIGDDTVRLDICAAPHPDHPGKQVWLRRGYAWHEPTRTVVTWQKAMLHAAFVNAGDGAAR